jgi:hypothetical protein
MLLSFRDEVDFVIINFSNHTTKSPNDKCIVSECTIEQSVKHGDLFASFEAIWSSCYADIYLKAFDDNDSAVRVLIDVGANKGYAVATWLAFFLPKFNINPARLGQYINSTKNFYACGSCGDCKNEPIKGIHNQQKIKLEIHAFEAQPDTVIVLKDIKNWMNISGRNELMYEIHGMAVSE